MKTQFGRFIIVAVVLTLLFTLGDVILTYQNLLRVYYNNKLVDNSYQINVELDKTLLSLINAETGQRGYVITDNSNFLEPYINSLSEVSKHISNLQHITHDNQSIQKKIPLLQSEVSDRLALLKQGIKLRNQDGFDITQAITEEESGKKKMDEIRSLIISLEQRETHLLTTYEIDTDRSYMALFIASTFTGLLNIALILFTYYLITREFAKRTELEKNKDDFFNMASHELKTPITSLNIFIHVLMKKINDNKTVEAKRFIKKIEAQTAKINSLITDFLDLARVQTGKMRYDYDHFNLSELIRETIEEIQGTTKKHKILIKGKMKQIVRADKYRISQVLVNLITNAIKYSPEGGKIIITVMKEKKNAVVGIQDQGIGIEDKFQDKIFDRLYQVHNDAKTPPGFGIGLYISKEIIKQHRGKIWVESQKHRGSTFYFSIPTK